MCVICVCAPPPCASPLTPPPPALPGLLDGITSKDKPIVKMTNMSFTYPGRSEPQLTDVNLMCRLSSRVACLGVNGAGKSTLIKVLTGEQKAQGGGPGGKGGEVWE